MKILITGGSGFLGRHLGVALKNLGHDVYLSGRNNKQNHYAGNITDLPVFPLDITSIESVRDSVNIIKPDTIIHAAATKFVDLSEKFPLECIDVNIVGSMNVARVAIDKGIKNVIGISTDKASPPVANIYGLSKATMEKMFTSLNGNTKFACVRYGNVVWSTGSIFPLWEKMFNDTGVIKSTGPKMRRYFFSVDNAVDLVIRALDNINTVQGKVLSMDMKSAQISSILDVWVEHGGIWQQIEGRPGDRIDEYLIGPEEVEFTEKTELGYVIHRNKITNHIPTWVSSLTSEKLNKEEIQNLINNKPKYA